MKKNSFLFHLIHSLTKPEKRFFKLQCSLQSGDKNYLVVFDAIEKMETYSEQELLKSIKKQNILKNLPVYKNYLYSQILKSLRIYKESKEPELFNLLLEAEILERKTLDIPCKDRLEKALKLAFKNHSYSIAILILMQLAKIATKIQRKSIAKDVEEYYRQGIEVMNALQEEFHNSKIYYKLFIAKREADPEKIKTLLDDLNLEFERLTPPKSGNFYASLHYFHTMAFLCMLRKKAKESNTYFKEIVDLWEAHPKLIANDTYRYKIHVFNYLQNCSPLRKYEEFEETLAKLRKVPSSSPLEEKATFSNSFYLELIYYMNTNQWEKAKAIVPEIEAGLKKYEAIMTPGRVTSYHYNITVLYMTLEEFETAQDWLNKILHSDRAEPRKDIQRSARILELVIHYELGNDRVIDYLFKSVRNKLRSNLLPFEEICLKYLKDLPYTLSGAAKQKLFKQFNDELLNLPNDGILGLDEISNWVKSKLKKNEVRRSL